MSVAVHTFSSLLPTTRASLTAVPSFLCRKQPRRSPVAASGQWRAGQHKRRPQQPSCKGLHNYELRSVDFFLLAPACDELLNRYLILASLLSRKALVWFAEALERR